MRIQPDGLMMNIKQIAKITTLTSILLLIGACSKSDDNANADGYQAYKEEPRQKPANYKMPDDMSEYRRDLYRHMRDVFNDSNKYQYAHAVYAGISPIHSINEAYNVNRPLVKISDNDFYKLDSLTHSVPFLVPEAATLLNEIAQNFRDTVTRRGLQPCRLRVTSLLRTPSSVKKLRRVNRNATDSSTHQFATTFDIAYNNFYTPTSDDKLENPHYKNALAEVLYDLRSQNRCMVKYETHSPCFHVTVIK
jgi:uncharacterized protein YcbK (DUF882 family)